MSKPEYYVIGFYVRFRDLEILDDEAVHQNEDFQDSVRNLRLLVKNLRERRHGPWFQKIAPHIHLKFYSNAEEETLRRLFQRANLESFFDSSKTFQVEETIPCGDVHVEFNRVYLKAEHEHPNHVVRRVMISNDITPDVIRGHTFEAPTLVALDPYRGFTEEVPTEVEDVLLGGHHEATVRAWRLCSNGLEHRISELLQRVEDLEKDAKTHNLIADKALALLADNADLRSRLQALRSTAHASRSAADKVIEVLDSPPPEIPELHTRREDADE